MYQHLIPKLGDQDLRELTPLNVQRYITELLQSGNLRTGQGLSANSVNSVITVIQGSMATAHLLELTDRYEMDKLKRPKAKEKPIECFTPAEQKQIEQAVMSDKREKMKGIVLCLYTGLRIGELLALELPRRGFHALRHTFATRAIECGMDIKSLSEILGHKNPMLTLNRYMHSLMDHKRAMMDKLGKINNYDSH